MIIQVGLSPKLFQVFRCYQNVREVRRAFDVTVVLREEFTDVWYDVNAYRLRPIIVNDMEEAFRTLCELSKRYKHGDNVPDIEYLEKQYGIYTQGCGS